MPMSRYEIRNEYSLADPELYRAADKDDPEALLEGVAMAGLVGVLRQLGDLAEFAAEIFRDLHEEVMVTAARGHGLMVRIQQLEAEVPLIEKAFLSQTNHSSFFYNSGVDWHPHQRMDQNLITQGDLPRFIMDSYEECRGPPRLFLLDKFDVAGAGACLKRYTDPAFFKAEAPFAGMTRTDVQREKKTRKAKKKGPRWRNGETPEVVVPTTHPKLHQLFLEEHIKNGVGNPARRVKLKRKLDGFPFNLKSGKSYMEKVLNTSSPEHKVVHEVSVRWSPLKLQTNDPNETGPKVLELRTVSPETENMGREKSPPSRDREETMLQKSIYEPNEISTEDKIPEVSKPNPSYEEDGSSSVLHRVTSEKDIAADEERETGGSLDGYQSDDIASERENYVDAPSTMDSEMDTDSEIRGKSDLVSLNIKRQLSISDANGKQLQAHSSDSKSVATSTLSNDGNNSSKKEISSFSLSDTQSTSAENSPSDRDASTEVFPSTHIPETDIFDGSSHQQTGHGDDSVSQDPKPVVSDGTCIGIAEISSHTDFEDLISSSCATDAIPTSVHLDSESVVGKGRFRESDEMSSSYNEISNELINTEHDGTSMITNLSCIYSIPSAALQIGDDFPPKLSAENHPTDESNGSISDYVPSISMGSEVHCITRENSQMSGTYLHRNDSNKEDLNLDEDIDDDLYMVSAKKTVPCILVEEVPNLHENCKCGHSDTISQHSDGCVPIVSEEKQLVDELDDGNPNVFSDASNNISCILEAVTEKANDENSLHNMAKTVGANDDYTCTLVENQIGSPDSVSPDTEENSLYLSQKDFELHDACDIIIHAKDTMGNEIPVIGNSKSCSSVGLQGTGIGGDAYHLDLADVENSHCSEENLDEPVTTSNSVQVDEINPCTDLIGNDATDITLSPDPTLLNEVHVQLDEVDSEADQSVAVVMATTDNNSNIDGLKVGEINLSTDLIGKGATCITFSPDPTSLNEVQVQLDEIDSVADQSGAMVMDAVAGPDNDSNDDNVCSSVDLNKLQEAYACSSGNLGQNEFKIEMKCLPDNHKDSGLGKEVGQQEAAPSGSDSVLCSSPVEYDLVNAAPTQSYLEQNGLLAIEQESCRQGGLIDHTEDASTLHVHHNAEETIVEETIKLLPSQSDKDDFQDTVEENLEEVPQLKVVQNLDPNDPEGSSDSASKCLLVNIQNQLSISEIPVQGSNDLNVSGYPKDPLILTLPPINLLSEANLINMEELPPLPPLPPVQWRMGKLQHASASERVATQHNVGPFVSSLPTVADRNVQNPILPVSAVTRADSLSLLEYSSANIMHSASLSQVPHGGHPSNTENNRLVLGGNQLMSSSLMLPEGPEQYDEMPHDSFLMGKGSVLQSRLTSFCQETSVDTASTNNICLTHELIGPLHQVAAEISSKEEVTPEISSKEEVTPEISSKEEVAPEISSKEEKVERSSSSMEANPTRPEEVKFLPKMPVLVMPSSEGETTSPTLEDGIANGSRTMKQPRPRNPLIDAVVARDRSKLRKVTERIRPEIQKVDERDSLLEQIRTKSFNLKPAVASRPSIQGPNTNLKVAAILEKANAIRQAFTGSDDDDEDSWSDS
ncbi:protein SCAR2-like isoform X2 [Olea europaea var. sylvestris]|uniref:protein SCAR2-like isoform X2 n=1 Tax=Olea europaea var. sylvestris TaxID=158386 RepID=UPI000C1D5AB1|nr:protein SCAR2-like isoform X2 [Olea europaea var. sylvestris]